MKLTILPLLLGLSLLPTQLQAQQQSTLTIQGQVPVICSVNFISAAPTGKNISGRLESSCNNPGGYRIYLDSSDAITPATLSVDATVIPLSVTGTTLVAESPRAETKSRDLSLTLPDGQAPANIYFRISPL